MQPNQDQSSTALPSASASGSLPNSKPNPNPNPDPNPDPETRGPPAPSATVLGPRARSLMETYNRFIKYMTSSITNESIHDAFPYATDALVVDLADQIKTLLQTRCDERWNEIEEEFEILKMCNRFDELEDETFQRINARLAPRRVTNDPQLSIPPLVLPIIDPLLNYIRDLTADQRRRNEALHAHILKQAGEADRIEKEIADKMKDLKLSIEQINSVMSS